MFQSLVKSPAWAQLVEYAKQQILGNTALADSPIHEMFYPDGSPMGVVGVMANEHAKGYRNGIKLFTLIPDTILEEVQADIDRLKAKEQEDDDERESGNGDDGREQLDLGFEQPRNSP